MPLFPSEDLKRRFIESKGLDPNTTDIDEASMSFIPRTSVPSPSLPGAPSTAPETTANLAGTPPTSKLESFGRSAAESALPTAASLGAIAGTLALMPEPFATKLGALGTGLAALALGAGAGIGASALQREIIPEDVQRSLFVTPESAQNKFSTIAGGFVPSALAFNPAAGLKDLPALGRGLRALPGAIAKRTTIPLAEEQALLNAAFNVGPAAAMNAYEQAQGQQPFDVGQLLASSLPGALFTRPWGLGKTMGFKDPISDQQLAALFPQQSRGGQPSPTVEGQQLTMEELLRAAGVPFERTLPPKEGVLSPSGVARMEAEQYGLPGLKHRDEPTLMQRAEEQMTGEGGPEPRVPDTESQRELDFYKAQIEKQRQDAIELARVEAEQLAAQNANKQRQLRMALGTKATPEAITGRGIAAAPEARPDVSPGATQPDYQARQRQAALQNKIKPQTEAERIQEEYDKGLRESADPQLVKDLNTELGAYPVEKQAELEAYLRDQARRRGFRVRDVPEVRNEAGESIAGRINLENREVEISSAIAKTPEGKLVAKAGFETTPHEAAGHGFLNDLLRSSSKTDQVLGLKAINAYRGDRGGKPFKTLAEWEAYVRSNPEEAFRAQDSIEETLAKDLAIEGTRQSKTSLYGTRKERLKQWLEGAKSAWKEKFGLDTPEDLRRHLIQRYRGDAPYGTRPELSPLLRGERKVVIRDGQEETQQEAEGRTVLTTRESGEGEIPRTPKISDAEYQHSWDEWERYAQMIGRALFPKEPSHRQMFAGKNVIEAMAKKEPLGEKAWQALISRGTIKAAGSEDLKKQIIAHVSNLKEGTFGSRYSGEPELPREGKPEVVRLTTSKHKNPLGDPMGTTYRATPEDYAAYLKAQQDLKDLVASDPGMEKPDFTEKYQEIVKRNETIKNKYGGMPPVGPETTRESGDAAFPRIPDWRNKQDPGPTGMNKDEGTVDKETIGKYFAPESPHYLNITDKEFFSRTPIYNKEAKDLGRGMEEQLQTAAMRKAKEAEKIADEGLEKVNKETQKGDVLVYQLKRELRDKLPKGFNKDILEDYIREGLVNDGSIEGDLGNALLRQHLGDERVDELQERWRVEGKQAEQLFEDTNKEARDARTESIKKIEELEAFIRPDVERQSAEAQLTKQVETPEFKRWFGESKVVDKEGKPLIVYHGTRADKPITVINPAEKNTAGKPRESGPTGFWTTPSADYAHNYSFDYEGRGEKSGPIYPIFAKAEKIAGGGSGEFIDDKGVHHKLPLSNEKVTREQFIDYVKRFGRYPADHYWTLKDGSRVRTNSDIDPGTVFDNWPYKNGPTVLDFNYYTSEFQASKAAYSNHKEREIMRNILLEHGYDAYFNSGNGRGELAFLKGGSQIKSAIGNEGAFDAANPDMRASAEPELPKYTLKEDNTSESRAYGHWISPEGNMLRVDPGKDSHETAAIKILQDLVKQGKLSQAEYDRLNIPMNSTTEVEDILYKNGWVRGVYSGPTLYYATTRKGNQERMTNTQKRALRDFGVERDTNVEYAPEEGFSQFGTKFIYERPGEEGRLSTEPELPRALTQEQADYPSSYSFNRLLTARLDRIAEKINTPTAREVTYKLRQANTERDILEGRVGNRIIANYEGYSPEEIQRVRQYRHEIDNDFPAPFRLTAHEEQLKTALDETYKDIGQMVKDSGLQVRAGEQFRSMRLRPEGYQENMPAMKVIDAWAESKPEAAQYDRLFIDHAIKRGQTEAQAEKILEEYKQAVGNVGITPDTSFGAIRKVEGIGLPWELVEKNGIASARRYGRRVAADLAFFKYIQNDPRMLKALGFRDQFGRPYETSELSRGQDLSDVEYIGSSPETVAAKRSLLGVDIPQSPVAQSLARLVGANIMQTGTAIRNLAALPTSIAPYYGVNLRSVMNAISKMNERAARAFENNAIKNSFKDFDAAGDFEGNPSKFINFADKYVGFMRKWTGRDLSDRLEGQFTYSLGEELATKWFASAKQGDIEARRMLNRFGTTVEGGVKSKFLNRDAPITQDDISRVAKEFVDVARGSYSAGGLPSSAIEGSWAPFLALSRWSIERSNNFWKDAILPIKEHGNWKPLLKTAFASLLTGAAIEQLNEALSGKKGQDPTTKEVLLSGRKEDIMAKAIGLAQLGAFGGIVGDTMKFGANLAQGKSTRFSSPLSFPVATLAEDLAQKTSFAAEAIQEGEDPFMVLGEYMKELVRAQSQNSRYALNRLEAEETGRKEKFRDMRVFNELMGEGRSGAAGETNPFLRREEREFKRTGDVEAAVEALPSLIDRIVEESGGDYEKLKKGLERLKANNYQTFPSLERIPQTANEFYNFLVRTQGKEAADARLEDFMTMKEKNRIKGQFVPSLR